MSVAREGRFAPAALTVAFTDSGGNAGVMADLRAFRDFKVHACAAVAGVTAQNPKGVLAVHPVPPRVLRAQLDAVLSCYAIRAAKTGMLHSAALVEAAAERLAGAKFPIVVDPVMAATSGAALLRPDAVKSLMESLLPIAFMVTPNIPEAEILSGLKIRSFEDAALAAEKIHSRFGCTVLLKGGHAAGRPPAELRRGIAGKVRGEASVDILFPAAGGGPAAIAAKKVPRPVSTHGTGCALSAAIAAALARGAGAASAVRTAKDYVTNAIRKSYLAGPGAGVLA